MFPELAVNVKFEAATSPESAILYCISALQFEPAEVGPCVHPERVVMVIAEPPDALKEAIIKSPTARLEGLVITTLVAVNPVLADDGTDIAIS